MRLITDVPRHVNSVVSLVEFRIHNSDSGILGSSKLWRSCESLFYRPTLFW